MDAHRLTLECLNGPRDGDRIEITEPTEMRRTGPGALTFAWDKTLGDPQCRFAMEEGIWVVRHLGASRGTHCVNHKVADESRFALKQGMILRASYTWLLVAAAE